MHGIHDRFERQTKRGDLVFHFRRHFRIYSARQEALVFHIPQLVREHFLRNAGNGTLEVGETLHSLEEIPQEYDLPSASDQVCGELGRTGKVRRHGSSVSPGSIQSVPIVPLGAVLFSQTPGLYKKRWQKQRAIWHLGLL